MKIFLLIIITFIFNEKLFSQSCDSIVIRSYQILTSDGWFNDSVRIDSFQNELLYTRSGYSLTDTAFIPVYLRPPILIL